MFTDGVGVTHTGGVRPEASIATPIDASVASGVEASSGAPPSTGPPDPPEEDPPDDELLDEAVPDEEVLDPLDEAPLLPEDCPLASPLSCAGGTAPELLVEQPVEQAVATSSAPSPMARSAPEEGHPRDIAVNHLSKADATGEVR
jgi:hypothetical protein